MKKLKHIISVNDFHDEFISEIFAKTKIYKDLRLAKKLGFGYGWDILYKKSKLRNCILITDFFQPSTRTRFSFESAMVYLGGNVIGTENGSEFSSVYKGESLYDNFKVISNYGDVIVGRFLAEGDAAIAAAASDVPLINGGDGYGEHPTQALLDAYTIMEKFGNRKDLHITFIGDLLRGRTVHSLVKLLINMKVIRKISFISSYNLKMPEKLINVLYAANIDIKEIYYDGVASIESTIENSDVVYLTRTQETTPDIHDNYCLTLEDANIMKEEAIIMHPLPRNEELPTAIDNNSRAHYFKQVENGLYIRMAILDYLCNRN